MDSNKIYNLEHEISNVEDEIKYVADYLDEHPDDFAVQLNLSNLQSRLNELKLELSLIHDNFGEMIANEDINLHISGKIIKNNSIYAPLLIKIIEVYEDITLNISAALRYGVDKMEKYINADFKRTHGHFIKTSPGSFKITFSPIVHEDNQTTLIPSLNKLSFEKLCELIEYEDNIEKILQQIDVIGASSISKYKKFIEVLDKNELDISMDDGNSENPKINIGPEKAKNIYNCLKSFEEEKVKIETIEKEGILYYINTDNKKCGIKVFDEDLGKQIKFSSVNFREGLKLKVKDKVDSEVRVILEKTTKINTVDENTKPIYDLISIE